MVFVMRQKIRYLRIDGDLWFFYSFLFLFLIHKRRYILTKKMLKTLIKCTKNIRKGAKHPKKPAFNQNIKTQ